ncbi:hypothetical protein LVD15_04345 [Fulvivirga maritima]|uniref:hypothetical protein n=1 Tax=Fulvivirga maritima TaxID=2904247 RepID=UPI001F4363F6|nr:hypothetical protein [Fulvivirga maritima]UII27662.1 hypothetical protein LVD15_04345 [Fulvivirga maritima]
MKISQNQTEMDVGSYYPTLHHLPGYGHEAYQPKTKSMDIFGCHSGEGAICQMPIINPPAQNSDSLEHDPANSSPVVISAKP